MRLRELHVTYRVRRDLPRWHELSRGTLDSTLVHPREVFKVAFLANAAAIVIAQNHPSGDPEPSAEDIGITNRLSEAGKLLGVETPRPHHHRPRWPLLLIQGIREVLMAAVIEPGTVEICFRVVHVDPADHELLDRVNQSTGPISVADVARSEIKSNLESVSYVRRHVHVECLKGACS